MPRQSRQPRKVAAVIPTTSLVASAARYSGKSARIYQPQQDWQRECYRHYAICGEARFAARYMGHAMSRAVLSVVRPPGRDQRGPQPVTGRPAALLGNLFNGKDGQAQMLEAIGIHLTIAGELYLVGRTVEGKDTWEIVSVMEMVVNGDKWTIRYGDGVKDVELTESDVVIRIWNPSPARRIEADSPFRSLLPVLTEIEWLTRHIFSQASSRLAGAGVFFVPQEMTFPPPPPVDGKVQEPANEAEAFMLTLADAMLPPQKNPELPSATVPIVVTAPADLIDKAKLIHFWSDLDAASLQMRREAIMRFADGMDLPREEVLGMSSNPGTGGGNSNGISHWGAWQIEEQTIKMHVEPMLELACNSLTIGYLRPLLDESDSAYIVYDTSALRLRPDRSKESTELYDRGVLSVEVMLRENGFDPSDAPDEAEFRTWLLRKVASGSATPEMVAAALGRLGVELDLPEPSEQGPMREERPDPSLLEHPPPKAPPEPPVNRPGDLALLAATDALVFRALERAGNRIRQKHGIKPPGVPAYEVHTLAHINGDADWLLEDAWSCAPQVLDGIADVDTTIQTLNAYIKSLFAAQEPHTRERLAKWLERAT